MAGRLFHHVGIPDHDPAALVKRSSLADLWHRITGTRLDIEGLTGVEETGGTAFLTHAGTAERYWKITPTADGLRVGYGQVINAPYTDPGSGITSNDHVPTLNGSAIDDSPAPVLAYPYGDAVIAVQLKVRFTHGEAAPAPDLRPYAPDWELTERPAIHWLTSIAVSPAELDGGEAYGEGTFAVPLAAIWGNRIYQLRDSLIEPAAWLTTLSF